jgi:hypothetical protein
VSNAAHVASDQNDFATNLWLSMEQRVIANFKNAKNVEEYVQTVKTHVFARRVGGTDGAGCMKHQRSVLPFESMNDQL